MADSIDIDRLPDPATSQKRAYTRVTPARTVTTAAVLSFATVALAAAAVHVPPADAQTGGATRKDGGRVHWRDCPACTGTGMVEEVHRG